MITTVEHGLPLLAVSDGRPGNARQAEALADALLPGKAKVLHLPTCVPWRWVNPRRLPGSGRAFGPEFARILKSPPRWVIGCGRQAALATRLLRGAGSQAVQILDPRISYRHWDWLVIPAHDRVTGRNVIRVNGSLNPVDDVWLAEARAQCAWLDAFPRPRLTVLVGGDSRHGRLSTSAWAALLAMLRDWHKATSGSVFLTTSRRTPPALTADIIHQMRTVPGVCWTCPADGPNPYSGFLAFADQIVCTADSVNLLSESCATLVPVCVVGHDAVTGGPGRFVQGLLESGRVQTCLLSSSSAIIPLRETSRIAALLRERF